MDCSPPGSSVHGISQARTLEWVAISSSRGSSQTRRGACVSRTGFFATEPPGKPGWAAVTECCGCSGWGGVGLTNIRNLFLTVLEAATEVPVRTWWGPYSRLQMAVFSFYRFIVMGVRKSFLGLFFFFFFNKFPIMRALLSLSNYLSNSLPPSNITLGFRILIWICGNTWRRKWQPTPVLLPGKSHWWRSLVGYSPWGHKELDMTERLHFLL